MKEYLKEVGFTIEEEIKPYGTYYSGFMTGSSNKSKIEILVSIVKGNKNPYVVISENRYNGHIKGHIKDLFEIGVIVNLMKRDRNS